MDSTKDMEHDIHFSSVADRYLKKLSNKDDVKRIREAIYNFRDLHYSKKLKGKFKGLNRIQIGKYRVIFKIYKKELVILVVDIGKRSNIHRK